MTIEAKIERLRQGGQIRVLDLFSGCGGISLGFRAAGYRIDAAIELDEIAALSHATNFCADVNPEVFAKHAVARDITVVEPEDIVADLRLGSVDTAFDVIVGGPPCQAYARVGRAKLREIADHPHAFKVDPRANLYLRYLHYIRRTQPLALLMENVPDILNFGGHNIVEEMVETLSDMGYDARYSLINAAFHGVPQMRDRVFMIAYHRQLNAHIEFPAATRHLTLPSGYGGTRSVALKLIDLLQGGGYVEPDLGTPDLPFSVTAEEALGDLPPITLHLEGKLKRGARRFDTALPYGDERQPSEYANRLRNWPGFEAPKGLYDHVIRYLPRDTEIFREMPNGAEYPEAHRTAVRLYKEEVERRNGLGTCVTEIEKAALFRAMVPPYPVGSFPNRWWKLRADFPSRTLMAHIGKDTYSHIHYDSAQARVISVREAARLQSFPDGFVFCGTMNPAYRQIGNAVPPVMAKALAERIRKTLETSCFAMNQAQAAE